MPIRPENVDRYPPDWPAIVERVRERSGDRCEGSPRFPDCRRPNGWFLNKHTGELVADPVTAETWELVDRVPVTRIVLTTGHLDHVPEHCDLDNLRHWCQRCHLVYDARHHAETAYRTRRARLPIDDLFAVLTG
jgi:hypothetical protein